MNKIFKFLPIAALMAGLMMFSCGKEDNNTTSGGGTSTSVTWVDLGLPSGTLWADRNVGANAVTDFGDYFAWGETQQSRCTTRAHTIFATEVMTNLPNTAIVPNTATTALPTHLPYFCPKTMPPQLTGATVPALRQRGMG